MHTCQPPISCHVISTGIPISLDALISLGPLISSSPFISGRNHTHLHSSPELLISTHIHLPGHTHLPVISYRMQSLPISPTLPPKGCNTTVLAINGKKCQKCSTSEGPIPDYIKISCFCCTIQRRTLIYPLSGTRVLQKAIASSTGLIVPNTGI